MQEKNGHGGHGPHDARTDSLRDLRFAFVLNLCFALAELAGGLLVNSLAILSDALHDFGDSVILGLSWRLDQLARRAPTPRYSFGFRRLTLLSVVLNATVLLAGSAFIIVRAVPRLLHPEQPHTGGMMLLAVAGVLVNGAAMLRLRRSRALNARAVSWHFVEDVLGWAAVLVGGAVMHLWHVPILDPLLSIGIAAYILVMNLGGTLRRALRLFLQATPDEVDTSALTAAADALPGVQALHHVHVWSLDGERHVLSAHIVVHRGLTRDSVLAIKASVRALAREAGIGHVTLEIEYDDEDCAMPADAHVH